MEVYRNQGLNYIVKFKGSKELYDMINKRLLDFELQLISDWKIRICYYKRNESENINDK